MIDRRWTSLKPSLYLVKVAGNFSGIIQDEFGFREEVALEAAGEHRDDRHRHAMCGEDVVRRVADHEGELRIAPGASQRGLEDLRRRLRELRVALRSRPFDELLSVQEPRIVLHLILVRGRREREPDLLR